MADEWQSFLNELGKDAANLLKGELHQLITSSISDTEEFVRKQAQKLERYLNQLARGEIDIAAFEVLMRDLERLTRMRSLRLKVAGKASAQRLADGIKGLVLNRLIGLIP